jgi:hypothetical protein
VLNLISSHWLSPPETSGFAPSLGALFMPDEQTKVCCRCKKEKLLWQFGASRNQKDGLYYYCKQCVQSRNKGKSTAKDLSSGNAWRHYSKYE